MPERRLASFRPNGQLYATIGDQWMRDDNIDEGFYAWVAELKMPAVGPDNVKQVVTALRTVNSITQPEAHMADEVTTITRDDVLAMRNATWIGFWHESTGAFTCRAVRERKDNGYNVEDRRDIPLAGSSVTDYSAKYTHDPGNKHIACATINLYHDTVIATFTKLLRAGDGLFLRWTRGNDTDTLREVGLHCDELKIEVKRDGKYIYNFLLEYRVAPENTARMVRAA